MNVERSFGVAAGGGETAFNLATSSFRSLISFLSTFISSLSFRRRSLVTVVRAVGGLSTFLPCCFEGGVTSSDVCVATACGTGCGAGICFV